MDMTAILGIGLVGTVLTVLLRQYKPEFALLASLATGLGILALLIREIFPILEEIYHLLEELELSSAYIQVLLKALGICFVTQLACDICKDAGEAAIAAKIEMAGKVAVLLVSLPLFQGILNVVDSLVHLVP